MASAHILIIDHHDADAERLEASLTEDGYQVSRCADGVEGLVMIDDLRPDLVISEVTTPRLGGMRLVKAIKNHEDTSGIPVILLTEKSDARSMIEGINVGAKFYVPKPCEYKSLSAKIKKAVG